MSWLTKSTRSVTMRLCLLSLILCCFSRAQVSTMPFPVQQFFDLNGKPCAGCLIFTYASGTFNPQATFTDFTGTVQNTNPIVLNSAGYPSNGGQVVGIWLTAGLVYRIQLTLPSFVQVYQVDGVVGPNPSTGVVNAVTTNVTFSGTPTFTVAGQIQLFKMTLTGNVTSSTLIVPVSIPTPVLIGFLLTQDGTGGRSFVWPTNVIGGQQLGIGANSHSEQWFSWDGTFARAIGPLDYESAKMIQFMDDGPASAQTGNWRLSNPSTIMFRNFANSADILGLGKDNSDVVHAGTTAFQAGIGSNGAQSGTYRQSSGDTFCWRNAANNADVCISKNGSDVINFGGPISWGGGTSLSTSNSTGTGSIVENNSPTISSATINNSTFNAFTCGLTNVTGPTSYTVQTTDCQLQVNAGAGNVAITIPAGNSGQVWAITRVDATAGNTVTLSPSVNSINNQSSLLLPTSTKTVCHQAGGGVWCTSIQSPNTRTFSQSGCTTATSTDSSCTGTINISPAMPSAVYIPQLTINTVNGAFLAVSVSGSLTTTTIPYTITCTFNCAVINTPTIYVHIDPQ